MAYIAKHVRTELLSISKLKIDESIQQRVCTPPGAVSEYAEVYRKTPNEMPALVAFQDDVAIWLAAGFTRRLAALMVGIKKLPVKVIPGTRNDAILFACGDNETHGYRRNNEDRRKAVITILKNKDWKKWTDAKVARICKVSEGLVKSVRSFLYPKDDGRREVEINGRVFTRNSTNGRATVPQQPIPSPEPTGRRVSCPHCGKFFRLQED